MISLRKYRIKTVDMDGFLGRERHPDRSDIGLVVTALNAETFYSNAEGQETAMPEAFSGALRGRVLTLLEQGNNPEADDYVMTMYTCVTPDERLLDLLDFELEAL